MVDAMWVTGRATSWMSSVYTLGKMAGCMRASTKMTRSTDSAYTLGLIRSATPAGGSMANNTGSVSLRPGKERND
jgi:hypothetical protein